MVAYFSGTGNTKFLAHKIAAELDDETFDLSLHLKEDNLELNSEKPFIVMSPIHAWGLPPEVENLLSKSHLKGNKNVYFALTMGANHGGIEKRLEFLASKIGLVYKGLAPFVMPNNYFIGEKLDSEEEALSFIRESLAEIPSFVAAVKEEKTYTDSHPERRGNAALRLFAPSIHRMFSKYGRGMYHFSVSDKCIRCLTCVKGCPMANIALVDGKIKFSKHCMLCLRCVSACPVEAIDVNGKAKENGILHLKDLVKKI